MVEGSTIKTQIQTRPWVERPEPTGENPDIFMKIFLDISLLFLLPVTDPVYTYVFPHFLISKPACTLAPKCRNTEP